MFSRLLDRIGDWNPQLFRELKGRLVPRNLALFTAISLGGQILLYLSFQSSLPSQGAITNRYCLGSPPGQPASNNTCIRDWLGHWILNRELWWLDLFVTLSTIGIFALLVVGTYLLVADLAREERNGTLNFIRSSPQSARSIFLGKMLGVPILLYLVGGLALPLHLTSGLAAGIPLPLILAFYGILLASCAFFYSLALWFGSIASGLSGFQAFIGSGILLWSSSMMAAVAQSDTAGLPHTPFDWLLLFYPGRSLAYLVDSTFLPPRTVGYFNLDHLADTLWYGQPLWENPWTGIGFILFNYGLWTYWLAQSLKRRFRNPTATWWSKPQSYWMSLSFVAISAGFVLQERGTADNLIVLQFFCVGFGLLSIAALSPQRQALQDWARYRHQSGPDRRQLFRDLIRGEKSPSTAAIAINMGIILLYLLPAIGLFPLGSDRLPLLASFVLVSGTVLMGAAITQLMLMLKTPKRGLAAAGATGTFLVLPVICLGLLGLSPHRLPEPWLLTFLPMVAVESASAAAVFLSLLGQWLAIALLGLQMARQLQEAGQSATQTLLAGARE